MGIVRTLIVDDSVVFRSQISAALEGIPGVIVGGIAATGKIALQKLLQDRFDLIILDLEMPEMSGIELLEQMREREIYAKVIVFSAFSERGAEITLDALRLGASDFVTKPSADDPEIRDLDPREKIRRLLAEKIRELFAERAVISNLMGQSLLGSTKKSRPVVHWEAFAPKVIVIGSSTGGPNALEEIFSHIPASIPCPILIAQHMPPVFTASLADRIGKVCGIPTAEGQDLEFLEPNRIYVAPGNFHMQLSGSAQSTRIQLSQGPMEHSVRPAVDPLFVSAARIFGKRCLGIILTGMGEDGKIGSGAIKNAWGKVVIQDQASSIVFGMPGAVFAAGTYDQVADLKTIAKIIGTISKSAEEEIGVSDV